MLTEKDYCDKDTAFALQELGYYPYMFYDDGTPAIHLWYAQKWLREEKDIHIEIDRIGYPTGYGWQVSIIEMEYNLCESVINNNKSYEEALSEGVKCAVKILKK